MRYSTVMILYSIPNVIGTRRLLASSTLPDCENLAARGRRRRWKTSRHHTSRTVSAQIYQSFSHRLERIYVGFKRGKRNVEESAEALEAHAHRKKFVENRKTISSSAEKRDTPTTPEPRLSWITLSWHRATRSKSTTFIGLPLYSNGEMQ